MVYHLSLCFGSWYCDISDWFVLFPLSPSFRIIHIGYMLCYQSFINLISCSVYILRLPSNSVLTVYSELEFRIEFEFRIRVQHMRITNIRVSKALQQFLVLPESSCGSTNLLPQHKICTSFYNGNRNKSKQSKQT